MGLSEVLSAEDFRTYRCCDQNPSLIWKVRSVISTTAKIVGHMGHKRSRTASTPVTVHPFEFQPKSSI